MRAYFAILKDSFREAMASRVLWVALIGIVLVLLALAPFALQTDKSLALRRSELTNTERFVKQVEKERDANGTPTAHLWTLLTDPQQKRFEELINPDADKPEASGRGRRSSAQRDVVEALNKLLEHEDFYKAECWEGAKLNGEAKELVADTGLDADGLKRRNLLLLAAAFPRSINIVEDTALSLTYGGANVVESIPIPPSQFEAFFEQGVIGVLGLFLGFFGIFGALLVTAGLIPRTFEPGEIALLLSKPVNRPLLFITKFLGGCTFTLLYSSVLVVGIWFLLGTRMNYWQINLMWCIPVYLFLFMIYFSVSAVGGAIWRNSIVSLVLVILFWLGITVVEITKQALDENLIKQRGIKEVLIAGDAVFSVDGAKNAYVWTEEESKWEEAFKETSNNLSGFMRRFAASDYRFAPVYDAANERILALQFGGSRFGGIGAPELVTGYADDQWERTSLGRLPQMVKEVFLDTNGRILLPSKNAIYEYVGQTDRQKKQSDFLGGLSGGLLGGGRAFREVQAGKFPDLGDSYAATLHTQSNAIYLFGNGNLVRLAPSGDEGQYTVSKTVEVDSTEPGVLAATGGFCILALRDGGVRLFNSETLEEESQTQLDDGVVPRICVADPTGDHLAILTHARTVLFWSAADGQLVDWAPNEDGQCRAVAFSKDGDIVVSDGRLAVHRYENFGSDVAQSWAEKTTWVYTLYDRLIYPVWNILPKPSQLDEFVPYVMSGDKTVVVNEANGPPGMTNTESLQQDREIFNVVSVFRNNGLFILVMLTIGCIYVSRRDF